MRTQEELKAAVERGAALLDRWNPNWFRWIDPPTLHMSWCRTCILGQIAGSISATCENSQDVDYCDMLRILHISYETGDMEHGFEWDGNGDRDEHNATMAVLGRLWLDAIALRQQTPPAALSATIKSLITPADTSKPELVEATR